MRIRSEYRTSSARSNNSSAIIRHLIGQRRYYTVRRRRHNVRRIHHHRAILLDASRTHSDTRKRALILVTQNLTAPQQTMRVRLIISRTGSKVIIVRRQTTERDICPRLNIHTLAHTALHHRDMTVTVTRRHQNIRGGNAPLTNNRNRHRRRNRIRARRSRPQHAVRHSDAPQRIVINSR